MTGIASKTELLAVTAAVLLAGCWQSYQEVADGGADGVVDSDADVRVDVDAVDDGGDRSCDGTWLDPTTGYLWENPPSDPMRNWDDAMAFCNGLTLCGSVARRWHLPTISELRSFVRGCPNMMTGGACGVTDSCLDASCDSPSCSECSSPHPGGGECYWDPSLSGGCRRYWSSSSYAGSTSYAWYVDFYVGFVSNRVKTARHHVRCVRPSP
jgi:hypothetical protein